MMFATDTVALGDVRVNDAGYLETSARAVRTGIQHYSGFEVGRPDLNVVNVYRDEAEVFSKRSLHSFSKVPVTVGHPPSGVNAANWKDVAVGTSGEEVLRDGERLKIGLKIMDAKAIARVQSGERELSAGYTCELVWGDGVAPDGTAYQARQTNIVADHIAIVPAGRAGSACRIGDSWSALSIGDQSPDVPDPSRASPVQHKDSTMKTHLVDGHPVEMSDAAIIAVANLQKQLGALTTDNLSLTASVNTLMADHAKAIATKDEAHAASLKVKDTELATKDAEIEKLKASQIDDAKLDALATARADVIGKAKALVADVKTDGIALGDIRRAVVIARLGDAAVDGKSQDYVEARFDLLADSLKGGTDALGRSTTAAPRTSTRAADGTVDPHAKRAQEMRDAWKQAPAHA